MTSKLRVGVLAIALAWIVGVKSALYRHASSGRSTYHLPIFIQEQVGILDFNTAREPESGLEVSAIEAGGIDAITVQRSASECDHGFSHL